MLTVAMPCRFHGQYLGEALASIEGQTVLPDAVEVIIDGATRQAMHDYYFPLLSFDRGTKLIPQWDWWPRSQGVAAARNALFAEASTEWVLPLDEDDLLNRYAVFRFKQALKICPDVGIFYSDWSEFGKGKLMPYHKVPEFSMDRLLQGPFIISASFIRKDAWEKVARANGAGYDPELERRGLRWEDYLFYLEAAALGVDMCRIGISLVRVRRHGDTGTSIANRTQPEWYEYAADKLQRLYGVELKAIG